MNIYYKHWPEKPVLDYKLADRLEDLAQKLEEKAAKLRSEASRIRFAEDEKLMLWECTRHAEPPHQSMEVGAL